MIPWELEDPSAALGTSLGTGSGVGEESGDWRGWRLVDTGKNSIPVGFSQVISSEWSKIGVERQ